MDAPPPYEIVVVPAPGQPGREELRQQCYDVRIAVFHHEQGFPLDTEIDDLDETATHFLLRVLPSQRPVGTIRCTRAADGAYYKLSRLAVHRDFRRFRFGRALVLSLHAFVRADAGARASHGGSPLPTARAAGAAGAGAGAAPGEDGSAPESVLVVCHSQIPAKGFYGKFGYEPEVRSCPDTDVYVGNTDEVLITASMVHNLQGEEFDEDGAPHQKMVARLSLSD